MNPLDKKINPGAYDSEAEAVRKRLGAKAIVLIVIEGRAGHGASVKLENEQQRLATVQVLRDVLRALLLGRDRGGPLS